MEYVRPSTWTQFLFLALCVFEFGTPALGKGLFLIDCSNLAVICYTYRHKLSDTDTEWQLEQAYIRRHVRLTWGGQRC